MINKMERMRELIIILNNANRDYYTVGDSGIGDKEYDLFYQELCDLENETDTIISNSPTHKVGYGIVDKLENVKHNHLMLSLKKVHDVDELKKFVMNYGNCLLMPKYDGLTTTLSYSNGKLIKAETRGDGEYGSDILHNAKVIKGIPLTISYKGDLTVDGETIIRYYDFEEINKTLDGDKKYANPRNLASGSLSLLDSSITKDRHLSFVAWKMITEADEFDGITTNSELFGFLDKLGFDVTPYVLLSKEDEIYKTPLESILSYCKNYSIPFDGAVLAVDNLKTATSMGRTSKFFKHSLAYKFYDETVETTLREVVWQGSRNGNLTPVAIFDTVNLEGSKVSRASLHNVNIIKALKLGIGDKILVKKSNMIIPQIVENITQSDTLCKPSNCPICNAPTVLDIASGVLSCTNDNCKSKTLNKLEHFVSKSGMNIEGLSGATIEKFYELGFIKDITDIYNNDIWKEHKSEIIKLDGFGEKSYKNIIDAIEKSKKTTLFNFLYALGIPQIGVTASKTISDKCNGKFSDFMEKVSNHYDWSKLIDFGSVTKENIDNYFNDMNNYSKVLKISRQLTFIENEVVSNKLDGLNFVVTGTLPTLSRDKAKSLIEENGGLFKSSVSKKTNYLLAVENCGSKLDKANSLGVAVINESEFLEMIK